MRGEDFGGGAPPPSWLSRPSPDGEGHPLPRAEREGAEDEVDWEEVRRAYELSGETVASIRKRFGLTKNRLERRRLAERWVARPQVAQPNGARGHAALGSEALEYRLNRLVTVGVSVLEKKVAEEGFDEESARTLRELCRAQEIRMRTKRNEKAVKAREKKNNDAGRDFRDDPAWLIAEINRRLDRLAEAGAAGGAACAAGPDTQGARARDA